MALNNPFIKNREKLEESLTQKEERSEVSTTPDAPQRKSGIPTGTQRVMENRDAMLNSLLSDEDDEETEMLRSVNNEALLPHIATENELNNPVLAMIDNNVKMLQRKYPTGGIKASRIITTDVLMAAAPDFFDKYEETISEGVSFVRESIGESDRAEVLRLAQDNPTDDSYQDDAFYVVSGYIAQFLEKSPWRDTHRKIVQAMISNEILGFGRLEPLWRDRRIDEIICNGPFDIQVEIGGQLSKVPGCRFVDSEHLMSLMERLYGAVNKVISIKTPLVKGRLHDKSRMFVTHPVIAPGGPNVNIRRHPEGFWTPQELINFGSAPVEMMTYIGNLIHKGASVLVVGGTGSGKTSLLNSLTGFYNPAVRIITLEDNLEMKPNPKKLLAIAMETRAAASDSDNAVTMRDLVKASMQMRPEVLIIGEVTDDAAYDLAQALNTGHTGSSTIHANTAQDAIPRISSLISQSGLTTIQGALDMIAAAFDVIVVTKRFPTDGSRKIVAVEEVGKDIVQIEGRPTLRTIPLWRFVEEGTDENGKVVGYWTKENDLSKERAQAKLLDVQRDLTWEELRELSSLPEGYLTHSKITE